jgi:hypothetical protein
MTSEHYIEEPNLSVAWGRALRASSATGRKEVGPLVVSVTGFDKSSDFDEEPRIRKELDAVLAREGMQNVDTVAGTIFPWSMWNPSAPRGQLFARYAKIAPRLRRASGKNRRGIYFERMITGGSKGKENQIEFALNTYNSRNGVRRGVLQIGVFHPAHDHSAAAQLGFPCLQHVTFAPIDGGLCLNAFYASQYMVERAYGNYVGLCRLGRFAAHELGLPLIRMTCFTGIAEFEVGKHKLAKLLAAVDEVVGPEEQSGAES